ncbi:peptide alpha-N-acetyltransferase complex B subunit NAT3 [Aspergillus ibericus CBS 121593]|uniref:N-acetyltransferase n=1 Tax=Aspergillus ibericus CBS 121593 TaxID=1448316 RepID=A0A395GZN7_9EURO|nr:N-acetyltransferase [Aspergillus ibericus CBS 121593]RAL00505.1 N-acetyltransferase [Aspergillus ibericus CBS 121593]
MSSIRRMSPTDLLSLNLTNLDPLTENYDLGFYLNYLMRWPSLFSSVQDRQEGIVGYIMGKLEEQPATMRHSEHYTPWHGHITVLTVAPAWRRLGHASRLTERLEQGSDINDAWFVDLYVRAGNKVAVGMYKGMGYSVFRRVVNYYSDDPTGFSDSGEDAFDMRKPCSRDKKLQHIRENGENFLVDPIDVS